MSYAERVAEHVAEANVVAAGLFQRRGTAVSIGADGGSPATHDPEREAPGFPSNTILAVTDAPALYAFHRNPCDGMIGRWPLGEVGAKYDTRESNVNHLEFVGTAELLLTFPDGSSAAFECGKRNDDCRAVCLAIAAGAGELTRNLPRPRSLDPGFTDWDPDDIDTWDERIVMVADDEDFADWQREWMADNGRG
jgi:hypothetical protein